MGIKNFFLKLKEKISKNNFENFPAIGGLMVSKMITEDGKKPLFMYREKIAGSHDSGWRIFSGFESEAYTDDPKNAAYYNPSTILKIDPSIAPLLFKGIGSVYEKTEKNGEWYKVTDFELDDDFMVTHQLTEGWSIEINNLFEREVDKDGTLKYTTGDKTVRIIIWNEENCSKQELYEEHKQMIDDRSQLLGEKLKTLDISNIDVAKVCFCTREKGISKSYNVIYAYSIIDNQVIETVLYFDYDEDFDWAVETWKNIKFKGK